LVIGSSVIDEEPKTPEEQLKSLPTQDEILQLPPFDLNEMPDIVTALKDSQPPDAVIIPVLDADNQILPEVLSELKVRDPRTVQTADWCLSFLLVYIRFMVQKVRTCSVCIINNSMFQSMDP